MNDPLVLYLTFAEKSDIWECFRLEQISEGVQDIGLVLAPLKFIFFAPHVVAVVVAVVMMAVVVAAIVAVVGIFAAVNDWKCGSVPEK